MRKPEDTTEADDWDEIDVSDQLESVDNEDTTSPVAAPFELIEPVSRAEPKPNPKGVRMSSETLPINQTVKQTVIEAGSEFKGILTSSCAILVNGTMDGQVHAPSLSVANTGALHGTIKTKTLRSQGTLSASVDADEVFLSGAIRSKTVIKTKRLEMKIASSNDSQLEVHFAASGLDASNVNLELASPAAPTSRADSGWPVLDAPTVADPSTRSPSKSSRRGEALGSTPKRR